MTAARDAARVAVPSARGSHHRDTAAGDLPPPAVTGGRNPSAIGGGFQCRGREGAERRRFGIATRDDDRDRILGIDRCDEQRAGAGEGRKHRQALLTQIVLHRHAFSRRA
jgi:hypothetical protein